MPVLPPFDILARLPLLPVLVWQGVRLRRTALVLPEAAGPRAGRGGEGAELALLIVGDSSAAGVGARHQSEALCGQLVARLARAHRLRWRLIARTGATTGSTLKTLSIEAAERYDVALVALGVNDAVRLTPARLWLKRQRKLREVLRGQFGVRQIVLTDMPPLRDFPALPPLLSWILGAHAARLSDALRSDVAAEEDVALIRFELALTPDAMAEDGYHPNAASYALWAEMAQRQIADSLGSARD